MRCPDCNKFVSFDESDPEVNDLDVSADGTVTAVVRIVNTCAECGTELKEGTFEFEELVDAEGHNGEGHELSVQESGADRTQRSGYFKKGEFIPASGRYAKNFYGVSVTYTVTCSCGALSVEDAFEDDMQASSMDEMV